MMSVVRVNLRKECPPRVGDQGGENQSRRNLGVFGAFFFFSPINFLVCLSIVGGQVGVCCGEFTSICFRLLRAARGRERPTTAAVCFTQPHRAKAARTCGQACRSGVLFDVVPNGAALLLCPYICSPNTAVGLGYGSTHKTTNQFSYTYMT